MKGRWNIRGFILLGWAWCLCSIALSQEENLQYIRIEPIEGYEVRYQVDSARPQLPHGTFRLKVHGRTLCKGHYYYGKRHGAWTRYNQQGVILTKAFFLSGKKHGTWEFYHTNRSLRAQVHYIHDQPHGHWKSYDAEGNRAGELLYDDQLRLVQAIGYYPNESVAYNTEFDFEDSTTYRRDSYYFLNNRIYKYQEFKDGQLHGNYRIYHERGNVWEELEYEDGRLINVLQIATWNGQPLVQGSLFDGDGDLRRYFRDGLIFSKVNYKDGLPHDSAVYYAENAIIRASGQYDMGKPTGTWTFRNRFNQVSHYNTFAEDGSFITSIGHKQHYGERTVIPIDSAGRIHGNMLLYNDYNEVIETYPYEQDFLHGMYYMYSSTTGNPVYEGEYFYNQKVGTWKFNRIGGKTVHEQLYDLPREPISLVPWSPIPGKEEYTTVGGSRQFASNELLTPTLRSALILQPPGWAIRSAAFQAETLPNEYVVSKRDPFSAEGKPNFPYKPNFTQARLREPITEQQFFDTYFPWPEELDENQEIGAWALYRLHIDEFGLASDFVLLKPTGTDLDVLLEDLYGRMPLWQPAFFNHFPMDSYQLKEIRF